MNHSTTLRPLSRDLAAGRVTARQLVEDCLARIADPQGEGGRAFIAVDAEGARAAADYHDGRRRSGRAASPFAGIPISVKDLFDLAGEVTTAGSRVLADAPAAAADATVVTRLRAAGFVLIGRTNMTEFAFSGLGLNPHYGTPANPFDRPSRRIPGGSSSGAAISITDGMAFGAIGTDTGGSCRIPAALTGIVGYKPTAARVPRTGVLPLSTSLDSVGPLANSVGCCATLDAVMAGEDFREETAPGPVAGARIAVPQSFVLDDLEPAVAAAFARALDALSRAGALITELPLVELKELTRINAKGGLSPVEAYGWHRRLLAQKGEQYDPRVAVRIERGREQDGADYIELLAARADLIRRVASLTRPFDALAMPTTPFVAPAMADLAEDAAYARINLAMLRNPSVANFLDRCAISLPCHRPGDAPVGFMLVGEHGGDDRLLALAAGVEAALRSAAPHPA